jgi:hypothetical protein
VSFFFFFFFFASLWCINLQFFSWGFCKIFIYSGICLVWPLWVRVFFFNFFMERERIMRELIMVLSRKEWKLKKDALLSLKFRVFFVRFMTSSLFKRCLIKCLSETSLL